MATINPTTIDKIETLRHLRADRAAAKSVYEALDASYAELRQEVLEELKRMPYAASKQLMKEQAVTLTQRQTVRVVDEAAVVDYLRTFKIDVPTKLDLTRLKPVLEQAVFQDGEVISGTEIVSVEYISLKEKTDV